MKRLVRCIAVLALLAAVIGIAVYFVTGGMNPAKKSMKNFPYAFEMGKTLGKETQKTSVQDKVGAVYTAYPNVKNKATDEKIEAFLDEAKERFGEFLAAETEKETVKTLVPRLIFDYTTKAEEGYTTLTCFYKISTVDKKGVETPHLNDELVYHVAADGSILNLDGVLGENSEKKINLMLKTEKKSTEDMVCFKVEGDKLTLRWAEDEKEFSVKEVERASLIDPTKPMIALTFDDGPGKYSRQFADLLAQYNGHSTFFVLGANVPTFSESLKYVYEMGNEIGSHTQNHKNLDLLSESRVREELDEAADAIEEAIGAKPTLVRTPYGNANNTVMSVINGPMIKWSVDTLDWQSRNATAVKNEILENTKDGDIVLLHEIYSSTYEGVKAALPELAAKGYQFVTVSELMRYRGVESAPEHIFACYPEED